MKDIALKISELYEKPFGGRERGRFRLSMKHMRQLVGVKRIYEDDIQQISRALYELGYALIDMESFFVVLSTKTFGSYRRLNDATTDEVSTQ